MRATPQVKTRTQKKSNLDSASGILIFEQVPPRLLCSIQSRCHIKLAWKLPVFKANPVGAVPGSRIARPGDGGADKVNGEAVVVRRADLIRSGYRIEHQGVATINILEMKSRYII